MRFGIGPRERETVFGCVEDADGTVHFYDAQTCTAACGSIVFTRSTIEPLAAINCKDCLAEHAAWMLAESKD